MSWRPTSSNSLTSSSVTLCSTRPKLLKHVWATDRFVIRNPDEMDTLPYILDDDDMYLDSRYELSIDGLIKMKTTQATLYSVPRSRYRGLYINDLIQSDLQTRSLRLRWHIYWAHTCHGILTKVSMW